VVSNVSASRPPMAWRAHRDERVQVQAALVERAQHLPQVTEDATFAGSATRLSVR
jgi:hypothetical protein